MLLALLCVMPRSGVAESAPAPVGCYLSTGDADWLWDSPPVQSQATIEATFDSLSKVFGVSRLYWRGFQTEVVVRHHLIRPENFIGYGFWMWEKHLLDEVGTSKIAVDAAHRRGMDCWGMTGLFEHGAHAEVDSAKGYGPSYIEDKLRLEYPECVPTDRHGIRKQAGPIEFAYDVPRKAKVERLTKIAVDGHYDGLMLYTYVEHFAMRCVGEFGYTDRIVEEYKRRYGRDIRTEDFDEHALHRLRGEYVTQFLRELSEAFHAKGKKLGVAIDPQNSHYPAPWLCARDVINSGLVYLDWERWVREGIVDEIMVYCNGDLETALNDAVAVTKGTNCAVSTIHSAPFPAKHKHLESAGVRRVMVGAYHDVEEGYKKEVLESEITGDDFLSKLRVIQQWVESEGDVPLDKLTAAATDTNPLVRRRAIVALGEKGGDGAVPAIEKALDDSENTVRCAAAATLVKQNGPESVRKILDCAAAHHTFQFEQCAVNSLANFPKEQTPALLRATEAKEPVKRRVAAQALARGSLRPEALPVLLKLSDDSDVQTRFGAAMGLGRFPGRAEVTNRLIAMLDDEHPTIRSRAAVSLQQCVRSNSRWLGELQLTAFKALESWFSRYGKSSDLPDTDWGWRAIGNALLAMGPRGDDVLRRLLAQRDDLVLADRAWRVLFVPATGYGYCLVDKAQARKDDLLHPKLLPKLDPPPTVPEPKEMPYLSQDFDSLDPYAKGDVGDMMHEGGQLRTLGDAPPLPVVQSYCKRRAAGNALRLTRGPAGTAHGIALLRADYRLTDQPTSIELWFRLDSAQSSFAFTWKDSGRGERPVSIYIAPGGLVSVGDGKGGWLRSTVKAAVGEWQSIRADLNPAARSSTVRLGNDVVTTDTPFPPLPESTTYNLLEFSPQGAEGTITYLDDIAVTVPNPAAPR